MVNRSVFTTYCCCFISFCTGCNTTDTNNLVTSSLLTTVDSIGANLNSSNNAHNSNNSNPNTNTNNNSNNNQNNNAINNVGLLGIGLGIGSGGLLSNIGLGIGGGVVGNNSSTTSATSSTAKKLSLNNATALNDHKDQGVRLNFSNTKHIINQKAMLQNLTPFENGIRK